MINIKELILKYHLRKQGKRQKRFPHYNEVRNVLILFESDMMERNMEIKAVRDQLLEQDKDVVLLGYVDKKDVTSPILPQSRILGQQDFNLLGKPRPELIAALQKRHYDLLIDLTQTDLCPMRYIAMYCVADFKCGLYREASCADLMIQTPPQNTPMYLYEQIIYYLKRIKSND